MCGSGAVVGYWADPTGVALLVRLTPVLFSLLSHGASSVNLRIYTISISGPHLIGANGKQIPAWGFRRRTV
jgi:hypothetical protein